MNDVDSYCGKGFKSLNSYTGEEFTRRVLVPLPYTVVYDPIPTEQGGFSKGSKLGELDVEFSVKMGHFAPGMVIRKRQTDYIVKRVKEFGKERYFLAQVSFKEGRKLVKNGVALQ